MSADVLRKAAALMRVFAMAAARELPDQRWKPGPTIDPDNHGWVVSSDIPEADWDTTVAQCPYDYEGDLAPHIAAWHPDVALAVADWLDRAADTHECAVSLGARGLSDDDPSVAVARAYLNQPGG